MKVSSYAKRIGISYHTAWRMWKRGQIPGYQFPTGTVIIDPPELRSLPVHTVAGYARMSGRENKKKLDTQAERLLSWYNAPGWSVGKVVKAGGSGINDQRPTFLTRLSDPKIGQIGVEHQDRASRFGVVSMQTLLGMQGRELVIVNTADMAEDDLMSDFVSIITAFCARLYGRRRAKRKTEQVLAALQQNESEHESETREGH